MKRNLLTFSAIAAIAVGGFAVVQAEGESGAGPGGHGGWHGHGEALSMNHLTKTLNLTPDQQAKVQPLLDQAKPQIIAIHKDAMQKTHAIMSQTMSQIRPLLNADQQKKFDDMQKAHQDMRNAMEEMHNAAKE